MKKFIFTLERMLSYKRSLYEKERNQLAQLRAERAGLEQQRDDTVQQMLRIDADFREKAVTGVSIEEVNQVKYHRENSDMLVHQLEEDMAKLDVEIEKQLLIVIQLDQDVKGLEKLREKQWEEYTAAAAKEEQERVLELVSSQFVEEQKAAEAEARAQNQS